MGMLTPALPRATLSSHKQQGRLSIPLPSLEL